MKTVTTRSNILILNRIILWICGFLAIPAFFATAWYGKGLDGHSFSDDIFGGAFEMKIGAEMLIDHLKYFTIWSNILAFIWVTFALIAEIFNSKKLKAVVEHPVVKGTPFLMMFITCFVSFTVLYPYALATPEINFAEIMRIAFLTKLVFQHCLVGVFLLTDMIITKGYATKNNKKESFAQILMNFVYSAIVPLIWLVASLILIGTGIILPQYPFMDLFDTTGITLMINIIVLVSIIFIWFGLWYALSYLTNRKYKHNKLV